MACNFIHVRSSANCSENFSGVGAKFWVFSGEKISEEQWNTVVSQKNLADYSNYVASAVNNQKCVVVDIKPKSGKVTATANSNGGGFSNVFTAVVANNMNDMTELARSLNNDTDWGILVPAGAGQYYVLYDKSFGIEFGMESDSGDTPDSDHGHTVTITCSPMIYAMPKISGINPQESTVSSKKVPVIFTGTGVSAKDLSDGNKPVTSNGQVEVGHVLLFTSTSDMTWPDGSVGKSYTCLVDSNGVNFSVSAAS